MTNGLESLNRVIEYIEENLTNEISCAELSMLATLSEYEFRRIFSFVIGTPVAEYIRKRRLSAAAEELMASEKSISEIAVKYGYNSASAFTRAFREIFGISPLSAREEDAKLTVYLKPRLEFTLKGGNSLEYTQKTTEDFYIVGVCGTSPISDTCCCESVWKEYESLTDVDTAAPIFAAYLNGEKDVLCYIGKKQDSIAADDVFLWVKGGKWVCFDISADMGEAEINDIYEKILFSFLPSGVYVRDNSRPNIEKFDSNGRFTVMIPVELK